MRQLGWKRRTGLYWARSACFSCPWPRGMPGSGHPPRHKAGLGDLQPPLPVPPTTQLGLQPQLCQPPAVGPVRRGQNLAPWGRSCPSICHAGPAAILPLGVAKPWVRVDGASHEPLSKGAQDASAVNEAGAGRGGISGSSVLLGHARAQVARAESDKGDVDPHCVVHRCIPSLAAGSVSRALCHPANEAAVTPRVRGWSPSPPGCSLVQPERNQRV